MKYGGVKQESGLLLRKAQLLLDENSAKSGLQSSDTEINTFIHELEVNREVMEQQNEELMQVRYDLEVSVRKYTELYDFAPTGYFTLSRYGKIIDLNLCGSQMLGKVRFQLVDKPFSMFVTFDTKKIFNQFMDRLFKSKVRESCELILRSGENILSEVHLTGIVTENREQCFVIAVDLTELNKAEKDIRNLNDELEHRVIQRTEQLEAANKELEAFSYSVSHDLMAPLRHISGFAEILIREYNKQLPEDARRYLDNISGSVKKMGALIEDLLRFSKIGRAEIRKETLMMNRVVEDALLLIRPFIMERKVNWNIETLPEVQGDYNLLRQVWVNLLDNAVKYSGKRDEALINVGFRDEPKEIVFYVKDNGVGFNMKYAFKLFCVFQRLHSSSQFDGTGIGLANVRRIISRHGGRTWAEAEEDNGATFYFSLPKSNQ
jgi:PAS domain S-box-containing protein